MCGACDRRWDRNPRYRTPLTPRMSQVTLPPMNGKITVALVQQEPAALRANGIELTREYAALASARGASLIAFPETWLPGYPAWLDYCRDAALWDHPPVKALYARMMENSVVVGGDSGNALCDIARDVGATLVIGVIERVDEGPGRGTLYNSLLTIGADGQLLNHHRKLMPTFTEKMVWGAGDADGLKAVTSQGTRIGGLICWEHWMPLARHALHESGEDVHVAVWPAVHERHQIASRHYAFEGRCYVLAVGAVMRAAALPQELEPHPDRVTDKDAWVLRGGSAIIGPDGMYVTEPLWDAADIVVSEIDLARTREESMTLDVTGHYHRPDLFSFTVRTDTRRISR